MNDGQEVRLRRDQSTLVITRSLDQPVDRSHDERVVQIKLGLDQIASCRFQRGKVFSDRVVDIFLADGAFREQRLDTRQILLGLDDPRFGLGDSSLRARECRFERHGIDFIKAIALLDVASLGKEALLDDAGDLRTNLDDARRLGLPDKLRFIGNRLRKGFDDLDFGDRTRSGRAGFALAAEPAGCSDDEKHANGKSPRHRLGSQSVFHDIKHAVRICSASMRCQGLIPLRSFQSKIRCACCKFG